MGKAEEEQHLPRGVTSSDPPQNTETQCRCSSSQIRKLLGFRCILVFLFSLALFLSALFWLPPFVDHNNLNDSSKYKGDFFFFWICRWLHCFLDIDLFLFWVLLELIEV